MRRHQLTAAIAMGLATGVLAAPVAELIVDPGAPIEATVSKKPARLIVDPLLDELVLSPDFVARNGIKPLWLIGEVEAQILKRESFDGKFRISAVTVAGRSTTAAAMWFSGAPSLAADGIIGPSQIPQARVTFRLGATNPGHTRTVWQAKSGTEARFEDHGRVMELDFGVTRPDRYPIASAAAGAAIAAAYGGTLNGPSWDVEILFGVRRPVRLLTLKQALTIGPLRFHKLAVRVRDRIDASGRGGSIREQGVAEDPAEIVVEARSKGPKPHYFVLLPRATLQPCSQLTFDKRSKTIELMCERNGPA